MSPHASAAPSGAWFRPSVRDTRPRAPRLVAPLAPSAPAAPTLQVARPAAAAPEPAAPRLGLLARYERWCWRQEQARIERYLALSVDLADLEQRMQRLARRATSL